MRAVTIRFRGIHLAQGTFEGEGDPGFLPFDAPLPVGTRVMIHPDQGTPREAIVTQVVEQDGGAKTMPGMKLRWAPPAATPEVVELEAEPPAAEPEVAAAVEPA